MKNFLHTTGVLSAVALAVAVSNAAVADAAVYGKLNLSLQKMDSESAGDDTKDNLEILSNASRLGFKGDLDIAENLRALAKIEYEVAGDGDLFGDNAESPLAARNVYVGLGGDGWGEFIMGRQDTPVKTLGKHVEVFNDYKIADIKNVVEGENRVSDMMKYQTPRWVGLQTTVMAVLGEENGVTKGEPDNKNDDGLSLVVDYKIENAVIGLGHDSNVDGRDLTRVSANYQFGSLALGALVQSSKMHSKADLAADETAAIISAAWKIANWKLKAQLGMATIDRESQFDGDMQDQDNLLAAIGVDYKLAKTTKVYGYYALAEQKDVLDYTRDDITDEIDGDLLIDEKESTLGFGIEHKF